jgi:pyruvate formate lyase activating enzyme
VSARLTRRDVLRGSLQLLPAFAGGGICAAALDGLAAADALHDDLLSTAPVARHWTSLERGGADCTACHDRVSVTAAHAHEKGLVQCLLCARRCAIGPGGRGDCGARMNVAGQLRSLVYGRPLAVHVDPIEKKPFFHFLPGSEAYSLGTAGCPLHCRFCQNWQLSQARPEDHPPPFVAPRALAGAASARRTPVIAFTYNEPTIQLEYIADVAAEARMLGVRCAIVSCGFMTEAPLAELCGVLSAVKIDLKGFSPGFYREVCRAELAPVLRSIVQVARHGVHLELVNLVVPTLNDAPELLAGLADWVVAELGRDVPVHFTRFHPDYQLQNLPPTPVATLERAREIAMARGIRFAYVGNVPGHPGNHTYCPGCGKVVIARSGFFVTDRQLDGGRCRSCGRAIPGIWS